METLSNPFQADNLQAITQAKHVLRRRAVEFKLESAKGTSVKVKRLLSQKRIELSDGTRMNLRFLKSTSLKGREVVARMKDVEMLVEGIEAKVVFAYRKGKYHRGVLHYEIKHPKDFTRMIPFLGQGVLVQYAPLFLTLGEILVALGCSDITNSPPRKDRLAFQYHGMLTRLKEEAQLSHQGIWGQPPLKELSLLRKLLV